MTAEYFTDRVEQLMEGRTNDWCASKEFRVYHKCPSGWRYAVLIDNRCIAIDADAEHALARLVAWLAERPRYPSPWDGVVMEGVGQA